MKEKKRIMVDMSATLIHHGHIRLLKEADKLGGFVIVGLTTDEEIMAQKGYEPELSYNERREILESIKYVDEVVPAPWCINDEFLEQHRIDVLVHGGDNFNKVKKALLHILPRTPGISSSELRVKVLYSLIKILKREKVV